jgi:hypothetical protein
MTRQIVDEANKGNPAIAAPRLIFSFRQKEMQMNIRSQKEKKE